MNRKNILLAMTFSLCMVAFSSKTMAQTDVYVGGMSNNRAVVWKNGTSSYLTTGNGFVSSVLVVGEDVYAVGYESVSGTNVAKVWKNEVVLYSLTDGTYSASANAIAVSGSDVYVVGTENTLGTVGKFWKNGVVEAGYSDAQTPYSIYINGNDVYVAGISTTFKAAVWKNGTLLHTLTSGSGYHVAYSVVVVDADVYTVGYEQIGGGYVPKVWKNNTVLYTLGVGTNSADKMGLYISNGDIYVAGCRVNGGKKTAKLWKNGVDIELSNGSNAFAVFVSGSDVYVAGMDNDNKALLWKNGNLTTLSSGSAELAFSVFIVDGEVNISEISSTQVGIYPNPTIDKFVVDFEGIVSIKLYDMLGKEVLAQTANGKTEININHLSKGVYTVRVLSEGRIIGNSKIVKQ
jgi:hypothetical protein